ncbi:phospholipid sterol acyl transferase 1 [Artemisia annua]|uniref:Phospholipid sterol acyl transferase 1 n=1 Tax=Artemisia annua TaxID=35608 RepID=A0A2U1PJC4_ARTAN|nr:phospholipid sterol acyl transferase 1 [Artemisia annua]
MEPSSITGTKPSQLNRSISDHRNHRRSPLPSSITITSPITVTVSDHCNHLRSPSPITVGSYFAQSGKPYPDNWIMTDVVYEFEGSLYTRSGNLIEGNPWTAGGDETVPYDSLSYCKSWLGPKVKHEGEDVQVQLDVEHHPGADIG